MERTTPNEDGFFEVSSSFDTSGGFHEYVFDTDELVEYTRIDGRTFDSFKSFAIKIVMKSDNPSYVPKIQDMRTVASF